jgi:hypothetical protein
VDEQTEKRVHFGRARKLALHAFALFIIYGNVAVALQPAAVRKAGWTVPRPKLLHDAFLMTGMFSSYSRRNADLYIAGERTQDGRPHDRGQWIRLRIRDHFAERRGVVFTQLFAVHHWDVHGKAAQRRAWKGLARRIRERHNRLHPDAQVRYVRFGQIDWPQDPRGYRAGKVAPHVRANDWYSEVPTKKKPRSGR